MANGHGGARKGAGRPRKSLSDKLLEGNPGKRKIRVLDIPGTEETAPEPPLYLASFEPYAYKLEPNSSDIYRETVEWLKTTGCLRLINPAYILEYAVLKSRWVLFEQCVSKSYILQDHKGDYQTNTYAELALKYIKAADAAWSKIWEIVAQNSETFYGEDPNNDVMLYLLNKKPER